MPGHVIRTDLSELTPDVDVIEPSKPIPYRDRVLPWGETCKAAEVRLKGVGVRFRWFGEAESLRKGGMEVNEACYVAMLNYPPEMYSEPSDVVDGVAGDPAVEKRFAARCHDGLRMSLPSKASIEREISWVCDNVHRDLPLVEKAPSTSAISMLLDARADSGFRSKLWQILLNKRLSPGDKKAKEKAFQDDVEDEGGGEVESLAELKAKMFGGS